MITRANSPKTIAIDARFYGEAGPGRYIKNVLKCLEKIDNTNKYLVFMRKKGGRMYEPSAPNFSKILADYKWYTWAEQTGFLWEIIKRKPDILYVPHFNIPVLYPGKLITAIPDIIMHTFSTEGGTTLPKLYFRFKKLVYRFVVAWAVLRSYKVIVPSEEVKKEFMRTLKFSKENKYLVAYEGVDPDFLDSTADFGELAKKIGVTGEYILHVGSMYSHKNLPRLLRAFVRFLDSTPFPGQLVLVGKKDTYSAQIKKLICDLGVEGKVLIPGQEFYVSDSEIVALRKNALFCVFPSLKEGFSLTPLESQSVGLPCVISDIPVHKEVYGDSVLYFNPTSEDDISKKLEQMLKDETLRKNLIQKGFEKVKEYSWAKAANQTFDVFREVLAL